MASLIKCDKCGMVSTNYRTYKHVRIYKLNSVDTYNGSDAIKHIDICNECYKKIFKEEDN